MNQDSARVTGMTRFACVWVENGTYFQRDLGGASLPGMPIDGFSFTL